MIKLLVITSFCKHAFPHLRGVRDLDAHVLAYAKTTLVVSLLLFFLVRNLGYLLVEY